MKPQIIIRVLCIFMLSISITACSNNKSRSSPDNDRTASIEESSDTNSSTTNEITDASSSSANKVADADTSISSTTDSEKKSENIPTNTKSNNTNNSPLEAYKEVLQNKTEFLSTDNKKSLYLDDFLTNKEVYGNIFKVQNFAVLDMDGDKIPEVVLGLSPGNPPEFYEVLHYMNGKVYGYIQVLRGLGDLKEDGTLFWSDSAAYNGCGKMKFKSNNYEIDNLGYRKPGNNNDWSNMLYFINNKPVTEDSYNTFYNEQNQKKDVSWYEFSKNNIETKLSMN